MKIQLLALDLDGTLLDHNGRLPVENQQAIAAARAAGIDVVLVTGRSWRSTREIYEQLGLQGPAICYLGALVVADGTGRVLSHRPLTHETWTAVKRLALAEDLAVTACIGADEAVVEGVLPGANLVAADTAVATCQPVDFRSWPDWNPYTVLDAHLTGCEAPPTMAAVYGDRAVNRVLAAFPHGLLQAQFDLSDRVAGEKVLHIWHDTVDKGRALAAYCQSRSIDPAAVMAMGDAMMDLSMIQLAGVGVAMPHGDEALQAAADWVMTPVAAIRRMLDERAE